MTITKKTTHVADAKARLPGFLKDATNVNKMVAIFADRYQGLEDELDQVREKLRESEKKSALVDELSSDKSRLQAQIDKLQDEMSGANERHDTIVLQLTRQIEQSQRLLEYNQEPFYRRWFRKGKKQEDGA